MGSCKSRQQCNQVCAQSVNYHVLAPPCAAPAPCSAPCGPAGYAGPYGGLPFGAYGGTPVGLVGGYGPGACGLGAGPC